MSKEKSNLSANEISERVYAWESGPVLRIDFSAPVEDSTIDYLIRLIRVSFVKTGKQKTREIVIFINSEGGNASAGMRFYDFCQLFFNKNGPILTTVVHGGAFSSAVFMALAGQNRFITPNSFMMIHQCSMGYDGRSAEFQALSFYLSDLEVRGTLILAEKTGQRASDIQDWNLRERWFNAESAIQYRLCEGYYAGPIA